MPGTRQTTKRRNLIEKTDNGSKERGRERNNIGYNVEESERRYMYWYIWSWRLPVWRGVYALFEGRKRKLANSLFFPYVTFFLHSFTSELSSGSGIPTHALFSFLFDRLVSVVVGWIYPY